MSILYSNYIYYLFIIYIYTYLLTYYYYPLGAPLSPSPHTPFILLKSNNSINRYASWTYANNGQYLYIKTNKWLTLWAGGPIMTSLKRQPLKRIHK
ncbi:hypothetical protein [Enterobacter phage ST22]|nr:hypothetical protein [Enterobacter phage ST22]